MNNQNKPQDNQKVEIIATWKVLKKHFDKDKIVYEFDEHEDYIGDQDYAFSSTISAIDEYASQFKSRIAELEKQNDEYREALFSTIDILMYFENGLADVGTGSGEEQPMHKEIKYSLKLIEQALNHKSDG